MPKQKKLKALRVQLHFVVSPEYEARLRDAERRSGRRRSDILRDGGLREIERIEEQED